MQWLWQSEFGTGLLGSSRVLAGGYDQKELWPWGNEGSRSGAKIVQLKHSQNRRFCLSSITAQRHVACRQNLASPQRPQAEACSRGPGSPPGVSGAAPLECCGEGRVRISSFRQLSLTEVPYRSFQQEWYCYLDVRNERADYSRLLYGPVRLNMPGDLHVHLNARAFIHCCFEGVVLMVV